MKALRRKMESTSGLDFSKQALWVQEYIEKIERQRDEAIRWMNHVHDEQTKSPFQITEMVCDGAGKGGAGHSYKTRYIQTNRLEVRHEGIALDILLRHGDKEIDLSWGSMEDGYSTRGSEEVAMIPSSYQAVKLVSRENMRCRKK
jgi:hypothetical protein